MGLYNFASNSPNSHRQNPACRLNGLLAGLILTIGLTITLTGPASAGEHTAKGKNQPPEKIYHNYCSVCHGDRGDAQTRARNSLTPPPRNFTSAEETAQLTRERMINSVTNGRTGTAMMPWKSELSPQEIESLVDYIRATFMKVGGSEEKAVVSSAKIITGDNRGQKIYVGNCTVCHGEKGDGQSRARNALNPPPRNFTSPEETAQLTRERMILSITNGRPGTAMMAWGSRFSKEDIEAVADHIRKTFMPAQAGNGVTTTPPQIEHAGPGALPDMSAAILSGGTGQAPTKSPQALQAADMTLPFPKSLVGNAAKGKVFFNKNCAACHGVKGNGQGPRAYFNYPKPRNFLTEETHTLFNRPTLYKSITNGKVGTVMPAWGKVLGDQEIADVAEYVFQQFVRSKPRNGKK